MYDEDESVSIAVNGRQVHSSGHCRAVSGVMSVMHNARALGKLGGCSKETSWDEASWGACEHACWASEVRRGGLGSDRESEMRPEVDRNAQGDWTGSTEHVCDSCHDCQGVANQFMVAICQAKTLELNRWLAANDVALETSTEPLVSPCTTACGLHAGI
jgi:hypothetical protein